MNRPKLLLPIIFFLFFAKIDAQILTESNLPIIIINTGNEEIPDEPKINATMGIIDNGIGRINNINDGFNHFDGNIGIETRGNSTQDFDEKTYSLELRTVDNQDSSIALLGMGKEEDWILHAMVIDKTQLRIPMSFYLFQQMGHYAANWRYVELVIDGDYRGLYILTERIKRDDNRVNIEKITANDIESDAVTGGYILRIDWLDEFDESQGFESNYESQSGDPMTYQWYYPKADKIQPEQVDYIESFMNDFEAAIFNESFMNNQGKSYTDYINVQSFVDFLLINELSKNSDGYKLSSYLHKDRDSKGGKLNAGPIWDFDQTYGASMVCSCDDFTGWTFLQNQEACEDLESMPMWWQAMVSDNSFSSFALNRWQILRAGVLHEDSLMTWIDEHQVLISDAIDRNFTRWDEVIGESIWIEPEPIPETYDAEIIYMKTWILNRLNWMDEQLPRLQTASTTSKVNLKIYPNPTTDMFLLEGNLGDVVQVISVNGQVMLSEKVTDMLYQVNINGLDDGIYIIRVRSDTYQFYSQKIIIQK